MRRRPYSIYLFIAATVAFLFSVNFTTSAIYRLEIAGLNPLQLILVGTALELAVFIFEIPTGVVADSVSRRLSIIIGYVLIGSGFLLEGALPLFATILLAQILWGLGYTFTSGARRCLAGGRTGRRASSCGVPARRPTQPSRQLCRHLCGRYVGRHPAQDSLFCRGQRAVASGAHPGDHHARTQLYAGPGGRTDDAAGHNRHV